MLALLRVRLPLPYRRYAGNIALIVRELQVGNLKIGTAQANQAYLLPKALEIPEHIHIVMNALERAVTSTDEWAQYFAFGFWNSAIVAMAIAIVAIATVAIAIVAIAIVAVAIRGVAILLCPLLCQPPPSPVRYEEHLRVLTKILGERSYKERLLVKCFDGSGTW